MASFWRAPAYSLAFLLLARGTGSLLHSLCYTYLLLPEPSQGLPQFFIRGYLDDQPIARFDRLIRKMAPLVPWMARNERFLAAEWIFRAALEKLSKGDYRAEELHIWQAVLGCEIMEDGSKGGFFCYGYDGRDFVSFDKETLTWVAAQSQAQKVIEEWEDDPKWSQGNKDFLEDTCIEWLQRYLSNKNTIQQRIEPPVGKVTHKVVNDSLGTLICQAFGFYPKGILATWTRDGEVCKEKALQRNVAPNSDGTYYVQLSIEIDPKKRHNFQCHLEHEGLQRPLVLALRGETATIWHILLGIAATVILGLGILFLIRHWRSCRSFHLKGRTCPDSLEMVPSPSIYNTEDETHSQMMLQPGTTHPMVDGGSRGLQKALLQCSAVEKESNGC
ncbi:major histocompatibility complex class I-related gene protein-like isoform X2 [Erythrolamprus reginae]|uniref:major histocompatibility complex class I-related gene protein-like isoform X2 n=1 Tax=Erythrolamprus reginae TaxID=121349 RepID=UPI00396C8DA3